jgi:hypothetical protein
MNNDVKALVLEPTELSVAKAARFGVISYLFHTRRGHPGPMSPRFAVAVVDAARELNFDPARDYVVVTGQVMLMVGMVGALVGNYGQIRALYFNGHEAVRDYQCVVVGEQVYANCQPT